MSIKALIALGFFASLAAPAAIAHPGHAHKHQVKTVTYVQPAPRTPGLQRLSNKLERAERLGIIQQGSRLDRIEDRIDRRADRQDRRFNNGWRDRVEDRIDYRNDRYDRRN